MHVAIQRVCPIIKVKSMPRALEFYCSTLGFNKEWEYAATPKGPYYSAVSLDGVHIHLSTFDGDGVIGTATYFYVDDVDTLVKRFVAHGLKLKEDKNSPVEGGPVDQTWGMREFYVRDPDRNSLRFGSEIAAS